MVADFKLVSVKRPSTGDSRTNKAPERRGVNTIASGPKTPELDGTFELGFDPADIRASTPKLERQVPPPAPRRQEGLGNVVLRIDNVPWVCCPYSPICPAC